MDIETQVLKGFHLEVKEYHNLELPINSHPDSLMIKWNFIAKFALQVQMMGKRIILQSELYNFEVELNFHNLKEKAITVHFLKH